MVRSTNNRWLHRFACGLAVATLILVALGGVVTTKGVGMAVPDWPTTYGHHMFFFPFSHWYAGIFDEHSHRVWASIVGILAAVFAIWAWGRDSAGRARWFGVIALVAGLALVGVRKPTMFVIVAGLCVAAIAWAVPRAVRDPNRLRWLGAIMFAAVIIQGVLGGLRVVLDVHGWGTEFGIFHGVLAHLFFLLVCSLALITSEKWSRMARSELSSQVGVRLRNVLLAGTALVFVQLLLGATMRHQHQGLAVPDFPLAYGKIWPAVDVASVAEYNAQRMESGGENPITSFHIVIHMLHRLNAFAVLFFILGTAVAVWRKTKAGSALRKLAGTWSIAVCLQAVLGILTIWSQRKVDVTTAHVALGAVTFMLGWFLILVTGRVTEPRTVRAGAAVPVVSGSGLKHA